MQINSNIVSICKDRVCWCFYPAGGSDAFPCVCEQYWTVFQENHIIQNVGLDEKISLSSAAVTPQRVTRNQADLCSSVLHMKCYWEEFEFIFRILGAIIIFMNGNPNYLQIMSCKHPTTVNKHVVCSQALKETENTLCSGSAAVFGESRLTDNISWEEETQQENKKYSSSSIQEVTHKGTNRCVVLTNMLRSKDLTFKENSLTWSEYMMSSLSYKNSLLCGGLSWNRNLSSREGWLLHLVDHVSVKGIRLITDTSVCPLSLTLLSIMFHITYIILIKGPYSDQGLWLI